MFMEINHLSLLVNDEKEALKFYIGVLGFEIVVDKIESGKRVLIIAPKGQRKNGLILVKADSEEKKALVGNQASSSAFFTLKTDNCLEEARKLKAKGVDFTQEPVEKYGKISAVFLDIYGNLVQMVEKIRP